jgi:hypothetical protein
MSAIRYLLWIHLLISIIYALAVVHSEGTFAHEKIYCSEDGFICASCVFHVVFHVSQHI